jgi:hypothetical protein
MTVLTAMDCLQRVSLGIDAQDFFSQAGILNLYVIAAALHSITFHIRLSMGGCIDSQSLRNMLSNWKMAWNNRALPRNTPSFGINAHDLGDPAHPSNDWKRDGFMKHAPEVWLLSKKLLWCIDLSKIQQMQRHTSGFDVMSPKDLLGDFASESSSQELYDDTSMSQLSYLLNSFEAMKV